ncbi:MAG: hypothetical protein PUF48_03225, partial [Oscillospiraceae bacterium]|nr:hypothetical protein [Oscillospiraceae bacterium]
MSKILARGIQWITVIVCCVTLVLAGAFIAPKPIDAVAGIEPDSSFKRISFSTFGIADGVYDASNSSSSSPVTGNFPNSFDKKYFSADVMFKGSGAQIVLAADSNGKGLAINATNAAMLSTVYDGTINRVMRPMLPAGTIDSFNETKFNLGVSFEVIAADSDARKNDLKVGVWINGALYRDDYFIIKNKVENFDAHNAVSIVCNPLTSVEIKSADDVAVLPDKSMEMTSINHFYVKDGVYGVNGGKASAGGVRPVNINSTYFTTNITFSATEGAAFRYAGDASAPGLSGLSFALKNGKLVLNDAASILEYEYTFEAAKAGLTAFANTKFKLGISFEYVDADEDTRLDDLKLGIWFNDVLYENKFI